MNDMSPINMALQGGFPPPVESTNGSGESTQAGTYEDGVTIRRNARAILSNILNTELIEHVDESAVIEIRLHARELRLAAIAYEKACLVEDAEQQIFDFGDYYPDLDEESPENIQSATSFLDKFGISLLDLATGAGERSSRLRNDIIMRFEKGRSCNLADNDVWQAAIAQVLSENQNTDE